MKMLQRVLFAILYILMPTSFLSMTQSMDHVHKDPGQHLFPEIIKVNDNFYYGKIAGKNLHFAMERVTANNLDLWSHYIDQQVTFSETVENHPSAPKGRLTLGSGMFERVLNHFHQIDENEIWVAYITKAEKPEPIPQSVRSYNADYSVASSQPNDFAKNIEIFVTVTTSPRALITSHVGVAMSLEGIIFGREKGTSYDLHSSAAKVMLMRNPLRKYMVNAPAWGMEQLFLKALPKSVFVGTREMLNTIEARSKITFEVWKHGHQEHISEFRKSASHYLHDVVKKANDEIQANFKKGVYGALTEQEAYETFLQKARTREERFGSWTLDFIIFEYEFNDLIENHKGGVFVASPDKIEILINKITYKLYQLFQNPSSGRCEFPQLTSSAELLKLMKRHPPLLSYSKLDSEFTIFDKNNPSHPWLSNKSVNNGKYDLEYAWMYYNAYQEEPRTHYIVVDLMDLAKGQALESLPARQ